MEFIANLTVLVLEVEMYCCLVILPLPVAALAWNEMHPVLCGVSGPEPKWAAARFIQNTGAVWDYIAAKGGAP